MVVVASLCTCIPLAIVQIITMKLVLLLVLATAVLARPGNDKYDIKYENINIDEYVDNIRLLKSTTHCFIGDVKCTNEGKDVKQWIPEATQTSCARCTEKQKEIVAKIIKAIIEKLPEDWEILKKQIDPEGKLTDELNKFLAAY